MATGVMLACARDASVGTRPELPKASTIPPQYRGAAFVMEINAFRRTVKVTPPAASIRTPVAAKLRADVVGSESGVAASLLGGDVIDLGATNLQVGVIGSVQPGKVLITMDLLIANKLDAVDLLPPTWPSAPAGTSGPVVFPFEVSVVVTSGGVASGAASNELVVSSPRYGAVVASTEWDGNGSPGSGTPHNFFNDVGCVASANDCFRYETFSPIPPLGVSLPRTVGFLIDPTVGDFKVRMIVAADLRVSARATQFGPVTGRVVSQSGSGIAGAVVHVTGGPSATTDAGGFYAMGGVPIGQRTVFVTGLPTGCTAPAAQTVVVSVSPPHQPANFTVSCVGAPATATIRGRAVRSGVVPVPALALQFTTFGFPRVVVTTDINGAYTAVVPAGAGGYSIGAGPFDCVGRGSYDLAAGAILSLDFMCGPELLAAMGPSFVSSSEGLGLPFANLTVTPSLGYPAVAATANSVGHIDSLRVSLADGTGSYTITGLPPWCPSTFSGTYRGFNGRGFGFHVVVPCVAPPIVYSLTGLWGSITPTGPTGRQVTLDLTLDMGGAPGRPDVNGAAEDSIAIIDRANFAGYGPMLIFRSRQFLTQGVSGPFTPSTGLLAVLFDAGDGMSGRIPLFRMTFDVAPGLQGTVTPVLAVTELVMRQFGELYQYNVVKSLAVSIPPLVVP